MACDKIIKSLKKVVVAKDFKINTYGGDISPMVVAGCGVSVQLDDGRMRPCDNSYDLDVWMLDDGRLIPYRRSDIFGEWLTIRDQLPCRNEDDQFMLMDDGRLIPRRKCDVDNFDVVDGRLWVYHDGG